MIFKKSHHNSGDASTESIGAFPSRLHLGNAMQSNWNLSISSCGLCTMLLMWRHRYRTYGSIHITSIPACRDAPCNETKHKYFGFKPLNICERIKFSIYFYFSLYYILLPNTPDVSIPKIITTSSPPP